MKHWTLLGFSVIGIIALGCSQNTDTVGTTTTATELSSNDESAPPGPPPEVFSACENKAEGDACSVTFSERTIDGTCRKGPHGEQQLGCAPKDPPHHGHGPRKPPPEAFSACENKAEGDACSVTFGERSIDGTCRKGPHGEQQLGCAPKDPPHHGHGPRKPPPEAFSACENKAEGDACSVTVGEQSIDGVCRSGPEGEAAACLPNRPPQRP